METETLLQELIAKCRRSPDFAELDFSDINQPCNDGDALIHLVAMQGGSDEMDLLVRSGANVNACGDMGFTPLHYAAMKGRKREAEKLLTLGADPKIRNEWGQTPEETALVGGYSDVAKLLKRHKKLHT
ncbi:MAG: ankyrin repeat domain-containing protein [Janthinobacterium lividum]